MEEIHEICLENSAVEQIVNLIELSPGLIMPMCGVVSQHVGLLSGTPSRFSEIQICYEEHKWREKHWKDV